MVISGPLEEGGNLRKPGLLTWEGWYPWPKQSKIVLLWVAWEGRTWHFHCLRVAWLLHWRPQRLGGVRAENAKSRYCPVCRQDLCKKWFLTTWGIQQKKSGDLDKYMTASRDRSGAAKINIFIDFWWEILKCQLFKKQTKFWKSKIGDLTDERNQICHICITKLQWVSINLKK